MELHIGQEIEKQFQRSGLKLSVFAEKINTGERNVYSIFRRKDISSEMLISISNALNYNFFKLYEDNLSSELAEPPGEYQTKKKLIKVNIEVAGEMEAMKHFHELLSEFNSSAAKHGFHII